VVSLLSIRREARLLLGGGCLDVWRLGAPCYAEVQFRCNKLGFIGPRDRPRFPLLPLMACVVCS